MNGSPISGSATADAELKGSVERFTTTDLRVAATALEVRSERMSNSTIRGSKP